MNWGQALITVAIYVATALLMTWISFEVYVGLVLGAPVAASVFAARDQEFWPVVHPAYSAFYIIPSIFAGWSLMWGHPDEWAQWLAWSLAISIVVTAALTLKFRGHIDREWAVAGTCTVVAVLSAFALCVANANISPQRFSLESALIETSSPGGYRRGPPRLHVSTVNHGERTFFVDWRSFFELQDTRELCMYEYEGALGWRWTVLSECPQPD